MEADKLTTSSRTIARIAVRSTVWVSLGTYLNQLIGFVATLIMTRLLAPEVFGFFSMATFWSTLLNLRAKSGLSYAAIRQPTTDGDLAGTYLALDAATTTGSLALSLIAAAILLQLGYVSQVVLGVIILTTADSITVIIGPLSMVLEKELQISRLTLVSLLAAIIAYSVAIYLAVTGAGIWSLLAINCITSLVSLGGVYWVCKHRWPQALTWKWRFNRALAMQLLRQGLPTGLSLTALGSIVLQFDNFLIGTFVGYTTLGFYDRAYRIAHWPNLLLTMIVSRIGFLTFAKVQNDPPRLTHAVRLSLWVLTTLGIPIAIMLLFGASDIVYILYTNKWSESAFFLRFLIIFSLTWPFVSVGFWLSVARGHSRTTALLTATQAAAIVLFATPLTLAWGVMGTILGVALTMALSFALSCYYVFRQVPLSFIGTFGPPFVAACASAGLLLGANQLPVWAQLVPLVRLFATGLIGPGAFILVLFALRPKEMIERLRYVMQLWAWRPANLTQITEG